MSLTILYDATTKPVVNSLYAILLNQGGQVYYDGAFVAVSTITTDATLACVAMAPLVSDSTVYAATIDDALDEQYDVIFVDVPAVNGSLQMVLSGEVGTSTIGAVLATQASVDAILAAISQLAPLASGTVAPGIYGTVGSSSNSYGNLYIVPTSVVGTIPPTGIITIDVNNNAVSGVFSWDGTQFTLPTSSLVVDGTAWTITPAPTSAGFTPTAAIGTIPASGSMLLNGRQAAFTWNGTSFALTGFSGTPANTWSIGQAATQQQASGLLAAITAIPATVWGYLCTAADTLGTTTIGGWVRSSITAIAAKVALFGSSGIITTNQPNRATMDKYITQFDDYLLATGNALSWSNADGTWAEGDLTDATITFTAETDTGILVLRKSGAATVPTGSQVISVELPGADTGLFTMPGQLYQYEVLIVDSGYRETSITGAIIVSPSLNPPS